jgi:NAD-dependent SIR2 family protein deacetylase
MRCPQCMAMGQKSTVRIGAGVVTEMAVRTFYDEEGRYHYHNPNKHSRHLKCSNGHEWTERERNKCPTCG